MIISFHIFIISFKITRETIWNTKRYSISLTQEGKLPMPCPRHGLTLALISMSMPCSKHGLTLALIMWPMPCPRHGLTLAFIMWPMSCPRHGLTLTLIMWPMSCPKHSLTLAHISPKCNGIDIQYIPRFNREFTILNFIMHYS
ncbi:tRNA (uracil-O(2)-)-methyltransferase [Gossypium arboreum]|uniref:tRNA (Uracil-O(2)-)-methyltransferase n=1 Tax=Gossypium arboreum TaxID=29729 RepID=A0A0B0NBK0_GOSAR|nr:tRNA (uracil-O(2)-)-methyltransferase [Gossypium arboreum]